MNIRHLFISLLLGLSFCTLFSYSLQQCPCRHFDAQIESPTKFYVECDSFKERDVHIIIYQAQHKQKPPSTLIWEGTKHLTASTETQRFEIEYSNQEKEEKIPVGFYKIQFENITLTSKCQKLFGYFPPFNIETKELNQHSVDLNWHFNYDEFNVDLFAASFKDDSNNKTNSKENLIQSFQRENSSLSIENLNSATPYRILIRAKYQNISLEQETRIFTLPSLGPFYFAIAFHSLLIVFTLGLVGGTCFALYKLQYSSVLTSRKKTRWLKFMVSDAILGSIIQSILWIIFTATKVSTIKNENLSMDRFPVFLSTCYWAIISTSIFYILHQSNIEGEYALENKTTNNNNENQLNNIKRRTRTQ
eukprot:gb/GECH01007624.1/.p1 GENE.gb/GECH01007624.1/~~gb/GECH01007624.1/.p1  ORF type:complete len:362 (+),score=74.48 gb/GECH01007624.1/:1-1086(+)